MAEREKKSSVVLKNKLSLAAQALPNFPAAVSDGSPAETAAIDPDRFYSARFLARRWDVHEQTIWKWRAAGWLSPPTKLGRNLTRWGGRVIIEFERQRAEEGSAA